MTQETILAYIAGIVDGEGYIGIKKSKPYGCTGRQNPGYHAKIQIRMVDEGAIAFIAEHLGGWYYKEKQPQVPGRRTLYCYQATDRAAATILENLFSLLIVKKSQAKAVLDLRMWQRGASRFKTKQTGTFTIIGTHGQHINFPKRQFSEEYIKECERLYRLCKSLNHGSAGGVMSNGGGRTDG